MKKMQHHLALIPLLGLLAACCAGSKVYVYPQSCTEKRSDNNVTLNSVLNDDGVAESGTFYQLRAGTHCVKNFSYVHVQGLRNLTFSGDLARPESVKVTCVEGVGLGFVDVSSLTLEGLTVTACGVTGEDNLGSFQSALQNVTDFFYRIHPPDVVAILVGLVSDFTVRSVVVQATEGLGLLVVNPQRSCLVEDSVFSCNHPPSCYRLPLNNMTGVNVTENNQVGGGTFFIFFNFINNNVPENATTALKIHNSTFLNNSYCGLSAKIALDYRHTHTDSDLGYSLGAGGGLSVVLAQTKYSVQVEVDSSHFRNNTSFLGGGAHIAIFEDVSGNSISFYNCTFVKNGLAGDILDAPEYYTSGAALYIVKDLVFPSGQVFRFVAFTQNATNSLLLQDCSLVGNRAAYSGAVNIYSLYGSLVQETVTFINCTLSENEGIVGAAMYVGELKQNGLQPGLHLVFRDVNVTKNRIVFEDSVGNLATTSKSDSSAAIEVQAIYLTFEGNNGFISDNYATAIRAESSVINIQDRVVLCNNSGSFGGGMHLIAASYVILQNNSHLRLENNTGAVQGGAFYVNLLAYSPDFNYRDCFLYFQQVENLCFGQYSCSNLSSLNFTLELIDNSSPLGSLIYGSTLDTCPWSVQLKERFNKSGSDPVLDIMYQLTDKFNFSSKPTTINAVTTPSNKLVIHDTELVHSVVPGELFYLNVSGYDHFDRSTPVLLSSKPSTSVENISSSLGFSNFTFLDSGYGDLVPVIVTGREDVTNVTIYLYATDSYAQIAFHVNLTRCEVGFVYKDGRCQCEPGLEEYPEIECNKTSMNLSVPNNHWVGPGPNGSLIVARCISDFCSAGEREIRPPDFDALCHKEYSRSGILCGQCVAGYSMTLGSHYCRKCDDHSVALIALFAGAGIIIMFGILILRITVSDGYLNSILFYTNILSVYIPILNSTNRNASVFVIVAWFNLDYGIEQCFYDGMSALTHVALRLVFPFYLLLLMLLTIVLSKKSAILSRFFSRAQFSAAKLFATVLLMSYATILEVCLELLSAVNLKTVDGGSYAMWRTDPNQRYFHGLHVPMVIVACILLFTIVLPAPILLIFPGITFSTRLGVKIKPVLDAFWAPFKTKFRFFIGLRLLLRMIPYAAAYLSPQPLNILLLGVFSVSLLFLQAVIQPFQRYSQNTLDYFFLLNTVMLVMGALYFEIFITAHQENRGFVKYHHDQYIYFTLFVTMAYAAFLLVILWHVHHRFPGIFRTVLSLFSKIRTHKKKVPSGDVNEKTPILQVQIQASGRSDSSSVSEGHLWPVSGDHPNSLTSKSTSYTASQADTIATEKPSPAKVPTVVNYSILREPLLEEGVAELVPANTNN